VQDEFQSKLNLWMQQRSAKLLLAILSGYSPSKGDTLVFHQTIFQKLKASVICNDVAIQPTLLNCISQLSLNLATVVALDKGYQTEFITITKLAISSPKNRPCLSYWIHFMTLQIPIVKPQFLQTLPFVHQISRELCRYSWNLKQESFGCLASDSECLVFLHGLEWIVRYMLNDHKKDEVEKSHLTSGWLFTDRRASHATDTNEFVAIIPNLIQALYVLFEALFASDMDPDLITPVTSRILFILEVIYKQFPRQSTESVIEHTSSSSDKVFGMLLKIANNDSTAISSHITTILKYRTTVDKPDRIASTHKVLSILQIALRNGGVSVADYSNFSAFAAQQCALAAAHKYIFPKLSKVMDSFFEATVFANDQKTMKEAEDLWCKILDFNTLIIARSFDQGAWKRTVFSDEDIINAPMSMRRDLLTEFGLPDPPAPPAPLKEEVLVDQLFTYFIDQVLDNMKQHVEVEKYTPVLSNFVHLVCIPCLKKTSTSPLTSKVVQIMNKMAQLNMVKLWKKEVFDWFNDPRFFQLPSRQYSPLIHTLFANDIDRFNEILTRRDHDSAIQCLNLRRVSFAISSGPLNHYRPQLPSIQEKISEVLKTTHTVLRAEGVFVLTCLFLRHDAVYLNSGWPTVLHQLMDVFGSFTSIQTPSRGDYHLLLHAAVLLVTLDTLQIDAFQWNKWIFTQGGDGVVDLVLVRLKELGENANGLEITQLLQRKWTLATLTVYIESIFDQPIRQ
jgi:hypothetical protein